MNINVTLNKDTYLVIAFFIYVLKKGKQPSLLPAPTLTLQCLTNIIYNAENHKYIYGTKIPEHLFSYIQ